MKIFRFIYRCRLCGEKYIHLKFKDEMNAKAVNMVKDAISPRKRLEAGLHEIHVCHNLKGFGIADLLGCSVEGVTDDKG